MKIYIAGAMTGYDDFNKPAFNIAAQEMSSLGHVALNPAILPLGLSQPEYMDICMAMIRCADGLFMLSGWESSKGAVAEHALAVKLGLAIQYQDSAKC